MLRAPAPGSRKHVDAWNSPDFYHCGALDYRPSGTDGSACTQLDRAPGHGTISPSATLGTDAPHHERASPRARVPERPSAAAALDDVHRRLRLWRRAALVLRPLPHDAGE